LPESSDHSRVFGSGPVPPHFHATSTLSARHGWITGVPGAVGVTIEVLPGSTLPDDLRVLGHRVREAGEGERILSTAITEQFTRRADGELEPLTEGSTKPTTTRVTHAGIATVDQFDLRLP
jgi:hypothetical protein